MRKVFLFASLPMILALAVMVTGCGTQQPGAGQGEPAADHHEGHDHEGHDHEGHDHGGQEDGASARSETGEYQEALAELAPADRELAEKQKVCPVSGQALGSMGQPYKVTVKGQDVLLCCAGCEAQIKEDSDKYLANLPK